MSTTRKTSISSSYKLNIFTAFSQYRETHFLPANFFLHPQKRAHLKSALRTINLIIDSTLSDEYDFLFLIRALKLVSELDKKNSDIDRLKNTVYTQLVKYTAGLIETTNLITLISVLFSDGLSASMGFHFLKTLLIDSTQNNLQYLLKQNKPLDMETIFRNLCIKAPLKILKTPLHVFNLSNLSYYTKSTASNVYEFAKSNLSFFHSKLVKSNPMPELTTSYFKR